MPLGKKCGGSLADYHIDFLPRPFYAMWATRYGHDYRTPDAMIPGPKVMLVNETAGRGGDFLPWLSRKFGLGRLFGKRTRGFCPSLPCQDVGGVGRADRFMIVTPLFVIEPILS